jgi:hypothetical protein
VIKTISLLHGRAGMSQQAFRDRYERVHAPLVTRLLGPFENYRRCYVDPESRLLPAAIFQPPDFDALTSIWFTDQSSLARLGQRLAAADTAAQITADEQQMFDRARMAMTLVDERGASPSAEQADAVSCRKLIVLAGRRGDLTQQQFVDLCERDAALVMKKGSASGLRDVIRNYTVPGGAFDLSHIEGNTGAILFDILLELTFADSQCLLRFAASPLGIQGFSGLAPLQPTGMFEAFIAIEG